MTIIPMPGGEKERRSPGGWEISSKDKKFGMTD
jgi:hypothetical protein